MKFQQKKVATALAYALGVGGAALVVGVPAQAADIKVDVTGSNIKRVEAEGTQPVQTIGREEIERTGVQNAEQLLMQLSANQSFGGYNITQAIGDAARPGFSGVSLRGLGSSRTLILLNGRRLTVYGFDGAGVDLNSIPLSAIERVEILLDGASAIYGSDAIAGVINFITRTDFRGLDAYAYYGESQEGDAGTGRINVTAGWGDLTKDKFNIWGTLDYADYKTIKAVDRSYSKTALRPDLGINALSSNSIPANIDINAGPNAGFTASPNNPQCLPPVGIPASATDKRCRFDFLSTINIYPPSERWNGLGRLTWQINPDNQFFLEGAGSHNKITFAISPTPVSDATFVSGKGRQFLLPPSSPFYPTAFVVANGGDPTLGVNTRWRALDAGLRTDVATSEQWRVVGGFQGVIKGWDYALAYAYNESTIEDNYTKGYLSEDILVPILNSGVVNPFALNTAAVNALIDTSQITGVLQQAKSTSQIFDAKTSNEIYKLPAGSLALALGYQYERQTLSQTRSDIFASGDIIGGAGAIPSLPEVNRSINSVYAELDVPIIKSVEANLAVRYDNYSDFGSTTNPKIGLRWQPNQQLLFRASWGTGFRAPSLSDLYQPPLITNTAGNHDDPLRCPFTNNASDCETQFNEQQGGNAVLQPEKSTQWGFGGVWEPVNGLSLGADYYNVEIKNLIAVLTDEDLFNNFAFYTAAGFVVRKPPDAAHPGLPGEIDYVITPLTNIGKQTTSGIDINAKYRFPATSAGQFNLAFNGTYIISYKQTDKDNNLVEFVGTRGNIGAISRWRHFVSLDWGYGGWGATVNQTFQNGYQEPWGDTAELPPGTIPPGKSFEDGRRVASYSLWDLQGRYTGFKNTTLALGVKNVLNQDPPTSAINQGFIFGYDSSYGQPFGRFFYGSIRYAFR